MGLAFRPSASTRSAAGLHVDAWGKRPWRASIALTGHAREALKNAPPEWLQPMARMRALRFFAIGGVLSLVAVVCQQDPPPLVAAVSCGVKSCQFFTAKFVTLTQLHLELMILVPHILFIWCIARAPTSDAEASERRSHVLLWTSLSLLTTQVRPVPLCLALLADQAIQVAYLRILHPTPGECWITSGGVLSFILFAAWSDQQTLRELFQAEQHLVASMQECALEKEASEALLAMHCDAGLCWVAADGVTVIHSSAVLDAVVGAPMGGRKLSAVMPVAEAARLRGATREVSGGGKRAPVRLLPTALLRADATPVPVDLFIVDRRTEFAQQADRGAPDAPGSTVAQPGFLVGVRLAPGGEEQPPAQGAQWVPFAGAEHAGDDESVVSGVGDDLGGNESNDDKSSASGAEMDVAPPGWLVAHQLSIVSSAGGPSCASIRSAATLLPRRLPAPRLHTCCRQALEAGILRGAPELQPVQVECQHTQTTVLAALELVCAHAAGGALVCVADGAAFDRVFQPRAECGQNTAPTVQLCDEGYMNRRLQGLPIADARFAEAFRDFTEHAAGDRWPEDAADPFCRGRPKDGAFLIDARGQRKACAAKLLGLPPAVSWPNRGTRHEAAAACAWAVSGSVVLVRSDSGSVCFVRRHAGQIHVYEVADACPV
uniref:DAC domain-containing protein n=1 Tax=Zooxanthella nutricula TaxID=1333877 RepID=A0A7S2NSR6_9DINO